MSDESEQRKHERIPIRLLVDYDDANDFIGDYTENLSAGGTFIHTTRALAPDTEIRLVLSFPGLLHPITLAGVVRWARDGGVGIEFLPGSELGELVRLIQSRDPGTVARVIRILVAEDNPHVSELLCAGLGASAKRAFGDRLAFYFATADDGGAALQLLQDSTFDLAIIDVYLPVLDGAEVITRVRSLGMNQLPIIAISEAGEHARDSALTAGANLFLSKPMRLRDVFASMRQLVNVR
jgi:uncharacterized protein (TIGR02266 family)